jgi:hypothetical protein
LARLTGTYRCSQGGTELTCAVVLEDGRLRIRTEHPQAAGFFFGPSRDLIPIDSHTFYAGVLPVVIAFVEDAAGGVQELRVDSTRLGGGGVRVWTASSKRS